MDELTFVHTFQVEVGADRLWPLLSNTDRLNRALALPSVQYELPPTSDLSPRLASASYLGLPLEWEEHPFEWVRERRYSVERRFPHGPVERIVGGVELSPQGARATRVEIYARVRPRNLIGWLMAKFTIGPRATRGMEDTCRNFVRFVDGQVEDAFPRREGPPAVDRDRLHDRLRRVAAAGVAAGLRDRLERLVIGGHDEEVVRVRPFELADLWQVPRLDVLRAFLHAAAAGVFDLEWELLCPNCRVPKAEHGSLAQITQQAHCDFCNIRFDLEFDLNVELRFSVNPNVRRAEQRIFCIGGPMNTPHVVAQARLGGGAVRELTVPLAVGHYRLRFPRAGEPVAVEVAADAPAGALDVRVDEAGALPRQVRVRPGDVRVRVDNRRSCELLLILEDRHWHAQGASAAQVSALQEFRELFSSEVLAPGLTVSIRNLAVLFTDLKGSTSLYEQLGDSPAFALVRRHFDLLVRVLREHQGALVKTIGDAVMASFASDVDCVRAALEMQREVADFNRQNPGVPLVVKIGAHAGPCVAVNANGALDYFGSTVNLAARIQNESVGRDVVLSDELANQPGVREVIAQEAAVLESAEKPVRGLSERVKIVRLWPVERAIGEPPASGATGNQVVAGS